MVRFGGVSGTCDQLVAGLVSPSGGRRVEQGCPTMADVEQCAANLAGELIGQGEFQECKPGGSAQQC